MTLDTRPVRRTATVAVLVAAVTALVTAVALGRPVAGFLGTGGAVLLGVGAWGLDSSATIRQASGSVLTVGGLVALVASLVVGSGVFETALLLSINLGVTLAAVDAAVGAGRSRDRTLSGCVRSTVLVFLVGALLVGVVSLATTGTLPYLRAGWRTIATGQLFLSFVVVQGLLVLISLLLRRAVVVLGSWTPRSGPDDEQPVLESLDRFGLSLSEIPNAYLGLLALQFLLSPWLGGPFARFFGSVLGPLFAYGVLQAGLAVVALALVSVLVLGWLQGVLVARIGSDPSTTLATAAGGLTVLTLAVVGELVVQLAGIEFQAPTSVHTLALFVGYAPLGLLTFAVAFTGIEFALTLALWAIQQAGGLDHDSGFAACSALLLAGALGGALIDVPAVAVFATLGGALLVWDLGTHAVGLGRQLGQAGRTDRAEFVHVIATTAVVVGAVVLATVVNYALAPALPDSGPAVGSRAVIALALLAAAIVAALVASLLHDRGVTLRDHDSR